jgi:hypothetical protein
MKTKSRAKMKIKTKIMKLMQGAKDVCRADLYLPPIGTPAQNVDVRIYTDAGI